MTQTIVYVIIGMCLLQQTMMMTGLTSCRLPVISTFVGGTAEVVKDGECGILCEPGDIPSLTRALEKLVNERETRLQMGLCGWKHAQEVFSPQVVLAKLEQCYKELSE